MRLVRAAGERGGVPLRQPLHDSFLARRGRRLGVDDGGDGGAEDPVRDGLDHAHVQPAAATPQPRVHPDRGPTQAVVERVFRGPEHGRRGGAQRENAPDQSELELGRPVCQPWTTEGNKRSVKHRRTRRLH